ncbi:MAG: cache domain-containing protein, partial [Desulfuromonadales bacterium]|nr:cache domain-containing protein [Desulfuromonadales bacterium]
MTITMSIKGRLILSATIVMLLSALVLGGYSYQNQVWQLQHRFHDLAINDHRLFETLLQTDADGLSRALSGLSRLEPLLEPFARGDRAVLLEALQPVFAELKTQHHITHMYFITMAGEVFLRAHKPEQHGDKLERATFLRAAATRSTSHGLEMGRNFFSLRCVTPVSLHGTQIGYMEVAQEIDHVFEQMKHITGNDFGLFLPASYLQQYDAAMQASVEGEFSLLYPTNRETFLMLGRNLPDLLKQGLDNFVVERIRLARESYLVGVAPIHDAFGKTAGVLLSQRNVTLLYDALWRGVVVSLSGFLAILVVGNALLYLSMRKSLTLFESLHEHIQKVTRTWDITSRLRVDTRDEIGELATDLNLMQDKMQKMQTALEQRANELAAANQELESFGYSLSHDLRS